MTSATTRRLKSFSLTMNKWVIKRQPLGNYTQRAAAAATIAIKATNVTIALKTTTTLLSPTTIENVFTYQLSDTSSITLGSALSLSTFNGKTPPFSAASSRHLLHRGFRCTTAQGYTLCAITSDCRATKLIGPKIFTSVPRGNNLSLPQNYFLGCLFCTRAANGTHK